MVDDAGIDVSTDRFWRSSIMANSARDPYWLASVRSEVFHHPDLAEAIEDKCATCHMPMAASASHLQGQLPKIFDQGYRDENHPDHALALDGVSCTLCHQIEAYNFGLGSSFSGKYEIDADLPVGQRRAYGPFPPEADSANVMSAVSGYLPEQSEHIQESELCATCHMLYTPYVNDQGEIAGEFPEQTPYLEWYYSDYRQTHACNDCHMPLVNGDVVLAITGGPKRSPVLQHSFLGGNAYLAQMLAMNGEELQAAASVADFAELSALTKDQLQSRTAALKLENLRVQSGVLSGDLQITVQTGHKFPSSFPSRRAWIELIVQDAQGNTIFHSGGWSPDGSIDGNENDQEEALYEPHYEVLRSEDQVQIYEAVLGDVNGDVTTTLLRASQYIKDNRLLPVGFEKEEAVSDIAPAGEASDDEDFLGGGDILQLDIQLGEVSLPLRIQAKLLYQSIGYRWAQNLGAADGVEIEQFLNFYSALPNYPIPVSEIAVEVQ